MEAVHQVLPGVVIAGADDLNDLVNVVLGDEQPLQQVGPLLGLALFIAGAAGDDLLLEGEVLVQNIPQGENPGLSLVVHQGQHIDGKGGLQLGLGEQMVQHHLGVGIVLELDDHPHAVAVGLIPEVGDALQPLFLHLLGDGGDEHALVDLVGQLCDNDPGALVVAAVLLKLGAGPDGHPAPTGGVGRPDAGAAHDDPLGGKVRPLHVLHQVGQVGFGVVQHADRRVNDLPQVVGGDVGGHAHGDAGGAVHQQVGKPGGQHPGFPPALVEVGVPVHRLLLNVRQHLPGHLGHAGLGVTIGRGRVAVHGPEVAVAVDEPVAHGEILGQPDQGVIHGAVPVGVILAQHVAHAGGGFFEGLVGGQTAFIHGV